MKKQFKTAILASIGAFVVSCNSNKGSADFEKTESGLEYKFYSQNKEGVKPKEGDFIKVIMQYKTSKDSVLFKSAQVAMDGSGAIEFPVAKAPFKGSFEEGLAMMSVGDSASFKVSADSLYLLAFKAKELPAFIDKGSLLTFDVKLVSIRSKEEVMKEQEMAMQKQAAEAEKRKTQEPLEIEAYIKTNNITTKPTASGLYVIEKTKGTGAQVLKGSMVQVHYTGMFLDGNTFDSSIDRGQPIEFSVGQGQVIPGWDEGLQLMKVGGKATFLIPSNLAYGEMGSQGAIPPYSPLLFDVEVVGVK
ncbi:MAG: FKBP-type peptidyl-prolyl cis-trans isomerase [Bacteroidetes bacterium]|nr:FKBP-type peptidyl-prolyl cis-trans isomerase [Bacteroidota bacterium]